MWARFHRVLAVFLLVGWIPGGIFTLVHTLVFGFILMQWIVLGGCVVSNLDGEGEEFARPLWGLIGCRFEGGDSLMRANKTVLAVCLLLSILRGAF